MNVVISTTYNFNNIEKINKETYENPPLFQFNIGTNLNSSDYLSYKSFYTWQGTLKTVKSGRTRRKVQNINPIEINKIYNNYFFYKNNNKTYFDYLDDSVKNGENCKENYINCGILDTNNNILCTPKEEECPLNDVKISDRLLPDLLSSGYDYIQITESLTDSIKYIYFTNKKVDNKIITHFELSADKPCISPDEHNWIAKNSNEKESTCNCQTYINENLYDPSYIEVGSNILMKSLYYDNGIPVYNNYHIETVNLYARNYYYLDKQCLDKYILDYDNLEKYYISKILTIRILQYIEFGFVIVYIVCLIRSLFLKVEKKPIGLYLIITDIIILYGIIINIIFLVFISGNNLNYSCGNLNINSKINNIFNNEFRFVIILVFSIIDIVAGVIILILNTLYF